MMTIVFKKKGEYFYIIKSIMYKESQHIMPSCLMTPNNILFFVRMI